MHSAGFASVAVGWLWWLAPRAPVGRPRVRAVAGAECSVSSLRKRRSDIDFVMHALASLGSIASAVSARRGARTPTRP
jgi:hypothetical protein